MEPKEKPSRAKKWVVAAAMAGAVLGSAGIAMAQTSSGTTSDTQAQATAPMDRSVASHPGEALLTGDTAAKVQAAAVAAVPGATVDRVENDAEGSPYEAHMTKADGSHVTVKVDDSFNVTTTENDPGPGAGHGGPPPAGASTTANGTSTSA